MNIYNKHAERIIFAYPELEPEDIVSFLDSLEFKENKSIYHLKNIQEKIRQAQGWPLDADFQNELLEPILFELESIIFALRSMIDICSRLTIYLLEIPMNDREVQLGELRRYLRPRDMMLHNAWNTLTSIKGSRLDFLHRVRNQIAHSKSLAIAHPLALQIKPDLRDIERNYVHVSFVYEDDLVPVLTFYQSMHREVVAGVNKVLYALTNNRGLDY